MKRLELYVSCFSTASIAPCTMHHAHSFLSAGLELQNIKKNEAIIRLETQLKELQERLRELKHSHRVELQEANVRLQQELYLSKHFQDSSGGTVARQDNAKPKHRAKPKRKA